MSLLSSLFGSDKEKLEREKKEKEKLEREKKDELDQTKQEREEQNKTQSEENTSNLEIGLNERDELFLEAAQLIITTQQGSASLLQRKLKLGYNRAGRIIDQLEAAGIVGPFEGTTVRKILVSDLGSLGKNQEQQEIIDKIVQKTEKEGNPYISKKEQVKREKYLNQKKHLSLISELDKDNDGIIDLVEVDDFSKILKKHQEIIIKIDRDYIKQFVQVSNYLKTKKNSIQSVYSSLKNIISEGGVQFDLGDILNKKIENEDFFVKYDPWDDSKPMGEQYDHNQFDEFRQYTGIEDNDKLVKEIVEYKKTRESYYPCTLPLKDSKVMEYFDLIKDDIHILNSLFIYSLNMIESLVKNDMVTFYEIHEEFDNLNMFDSKHEKDLKSQLDNLNKNFVEVIGQIELMGEKIVSSINNLSAISEESTRMIQKGLKSVESSVNTNNLISAIQTYQTYKLNKNLKS